MIARLLIAITALLPGFAFGAVDYTLVPRILPKLVKVEATLPSGRVAAGSGVMVAKETIATNCHVTRGSKAVQVWNGGAKWTVAAQNANLDHDICVLFVPGAPEYLIFPMAAEPPKAGEQVLGAGHSGGYDLRVGLGEVVALHEHDGAKVIQTNSIFDSGASGGGLFNGKGELIGIVTFRHGGRAKGGYHFSLPVEWVRQGMKREGAQDIATPLEGKVFWEAERARQPYFLQSVALEVENKWPELKALSEHWTKGEPENVGAWLSLGRSQRELRDHAAAITAYRRAVELSPDNANTWFDLGLVYAASGQKDGVAEVHDKLARLAPERVEEFDEMARLEKRD